MLRLVLFPVVFVLCVLVAGCGTSATIIGTVDDKPITLREFEEMYARNNGGWEKASKSTLEERQKFLDLYAKYRLKLLEAQNQRLLSDSSLRAEMAEYRRTIATTYMLEKELIEPGVRKLYERRKEDLRASHILLRIPANATREDSARVYRKIKSLLPLIPQWGFDSVAVVYSEDPSVKTNRGDLGWFSQGRMVDDFEDAAYALKAGEVTGEPVLTQFGFHLIKVTGRRPNMGHVRVAHLLKRFNAQKSDTAAVRDTMAAIHRMLQRNELSFPDATQRYSEDPSSSRRGGDLGWYDWNMIPADVFDLLQQLPVNGVAPPYRAPHGYHIFKVLEKRSITPFADAERELRELYQQRYYSREYADFLHRLKSLYQFRFDIELRSQLFSYFDPQKTPGDSSWANGIPPGTLEKPLFTCGTRTFTLRNFVDHVNLSEEFRTKKLTQANLDEMIERIVDTVVLEEHAAKLNDRHPEFKNLMQDYENGLLIYQIDQNEIWRKIVVNDSLVRNYFEHNRNDFQWPDRINVGEIHVTKDSVANEVYRRLRKGESFADLAVQYTVRPGFKEKRGEWGLLPLDANGLTSRAARMKDDSISTPFRYESGWSIITVLGREAPRPKTFEEALPEVTSKYQEEAAKRREQEWIDSLKRKYRLTLDPEKLPQAFAKQSDT